ncbi:vesicular inhibitory amino acid transporter-like [Actinia tenebrosa]|uniref:Vesicular inhibitory amino acid transporter-like n=1 Tax=Actinia tenebrosa TaxID=6105 RepID=A0A6P8INB9_ACTTE|nr:vesicular inhibitory amino acid transporter-like [Actinia tenebrosa]
MAKSILEEKAYHLLSSKEEAPSYTEEKTEAISIDEEPTEEEANKSTMWQTVCNLVSDLEGTGLLGLPYVLKEGGWLAVVMLTVVPFMCFYTGKILIECLYDKNNKDEKVRIRRNYRDMAEASSPKYGGIIVVAIQVVELTLLASLYLVLCGHLIHAMVPVLSLNAWMLISAVVGLPSIFFKHLSQVAWISLISLIALTIAIIIVLGYGFSQSLQWDIRAIALWDIKGAPISLAIITFSYICHPCLPAIEASMKDPTKYNAMLGITYAFVFMIKIVFSVMGLFTFSTNINEVITNSLPKGKLHILVNSFLIINVLFSYPFRVMTIIHCVEDSVVPESCRSKFNDILWFVGIRVLINFITLLPAIMVPHFALMMSCVGSLTGMSVVFVLPCFFHLRLKSGELEWYQKGLDYFLIGFGVIVAIIGLILSGRALI